MTTIIRSAAAAQRTALRELLHNAVIAGELPADRVDSAADFVDATLAGIRYAAKTGNSRKALRELACLAADRACSATAAASRRAYRPPRTRDLAALPISTFEKSCRVVRGLPCGITLERNNVSEVVVLH